MRLKIAVTCLLFAAQGALACSCALQAPREGETEQAYLYRDLADKVNRSKGVLVITVLDRFTRSSRGESSMGYGYKVRVERSLSNDARNSESILYDDGACPPNFQPKQRWVIFLDQRNLLGLCSGNILLDGTTSQIRRVQVLEEIFGVPIARTRH